MASLSHALKEAKGKPKDYLILTGMCGVKKIWID